MDSSSSDSDLLEVVRNIQAVIIKSDSADQESNKKYAYKRRLGDLIFDANFEAGNLGLVEQINEYEYELMVRPDVTNPRIRLWFNFTVSNQLPNQCVIFTFVNFSERVSLFHEGLTPVVRSKHMPDWLRLHEDQVFYYRSANHGNRYVLSLAFRFSSYDNMHQFSLFYPYGYTALTNFIQRWQVELKRIQRQKIRSRDSLERSNSVDHETTYTELKPGSQNEDLRTKSSLGFYKIALLSECEKIGQDVDFKINQLASSILSKRILHISLRGQNNSNGSLRPKVVIIARSSGNLDSVASYVCQGSIDYLLSDNLIARAARQYIDFEFLPMIDPDSVLAGNSKSDIMGQANLTPKVIKANPSIYSNYHKARELVAKICENSNCRVIVLEIRVGMDLIGSRIVGSFYEDNLRMERHLSLPRLLTRFTNDFYLETCEFRGFSRNNVSLFDLGEENVMCHLDSYRLEISPFAYYKRSLMERSYKEYDQKKYLSIGKAIVFAMLELLRPKDRPLPYGVAAILDAFHPKSEDIDDLLLRQV